MSAPAGPTWIWDAQRLIGGKHHVAGVAPLHVVGQRLAVQGAGGAHVGPENQGDTAHLAPALGNGLAALPAEQLSDLLGVLVIQLQESVENGVPLVIAQGGPFLLALHRVGYGPVHVFFGGGRNRPDQLPVIGVEIFECRPVRCVHKFPADQHFHVH